MVVGPSTIWRDRHHHSRIDSTSSVLSSFSDQSKVLKVIMTTLANMLNDTSVASIGNDTVFRNNIAKGNASAMLPDILDLLKDPDEGALSRSTLQALILALGIFFAFVTTVGNLMVMVSFKVDKQLRTISNYFLFSLAVADITIGFISIPLMTYYTVTGFWGIGYVACQFWLCIDYLMSNASVLNLLLISFDRYFSVTHPLTYRPRRTTKKALFAIGMTYLISTILWPPWIVSWPYIEGKFITEPGTCVVQFLETNPYVTVGTAVAAFYLPVTIMIILYSRVYCETKRRQREFRKLQAGQMFTPTEIGATSALQQLFVPLLLMRNRTSLSNNTSNSNPPAGTTGINNSDSIKRKQMFPFMEGIMNARLNKKHRRCNWLRACAGKSEYSSEESSEVPNNPDETSLASSVYATSLATKRSVKASSTISNQENTGAEETASLDAPTSSTDPQPPPISPRSRTLTGSENRFRSRNASERPLLHNYTVLIELREGEGKRPSVRLSSCDASSNLRPSLGDGGAAGNCRTPMRKRSRSDVAATVDDIKRVSMAAEVIEKQGSTKSTTTKGNGTSSEPHQNGKVKGIEKNDNRKSEKEKRKNERKQDSKAAKTLSAILIAFIITWTPYNVIVVWEAFFPKSVPSVLFTISYCLCYINSTINPVCYALCNARFRICFQRILRCRWKQDRSQNGLYRNAYLRRV